MKPLNRAKELKKESANLGSTPNYKSVIHKPTKKSEAKAKEKAFGKPVVHTPKKPNRPKKKKNKKAGVPLSAKVGAGVAGVALVGGSVAAIVHNMNSGNKNVQDANRHSDDSGLNFGSSKDSSSNKNDKSKLNKDKNDKKNNKKDKGKDKKSEDALSDLLGDDSSESASGSSSKSDKSSKSDDKSDLDSLIDGLSGGNADADKGLKELAKKANKSVAEASKLGGKAAAKESKSNEEKPSELPNAQKDDSKGKGSASALTDLAYKPNVKENANDSKTGDDNGNGTGRSTTQHTETRPNGNADSSRGKSETSQPSSHNTGNNTGSSNKPDKNTGGNAGGTIKPDNPNHGNTGGDTGGTTKPGNPNHGTTGGDTGGTTKPGNPNHDNTGGDTGGTTKPGNPDHGTTGGDTGGTTKPGNPDHGTTGGDTGGTTKPGNPDHGNTGGDTGGTTKPDNPDHGTTGGDTGGTTKPGNPDHGTTGGDTGGTTKPDNPDHGNTGGDTGGTTKPDNPTQTYPYQNVPDGTTKNVQFVTSDGMVVGTGTLSKNGNSVSVANIPSGYKLSDLDGEGHSAQLLQWPDQITVVSDGTSQPDQPSNPTYPYQNVPDGTTKNVQFVTSDGTVVGTGTLSKNGNSVSVANIPGGYKLADLDSEGHSAQLLQWPNQITVISDGTSQSDNPSQPDTPKYPAESVPSGTTKSVQFVTADGTVVGTGTLSKDGNSVRISDIPGGYKLADLDSEGHSAQLLQWPDQITVVSNGTGQPSNPTYPFLNVPDGTSKDVQFVTSDGSIVGTGQLTRNGNSVHLSGIPGGYKLSDEDSAGHSAQLYQWPNQITVISDGTSQQNTPTNPTTLSYPAESVSDGTSKSIQFVTSDGTVVGTGTLSRTNGMVKLDGIPADYKLADEDSAGHSAQLLQWPDRIVVASM
ncbi:MAG: hypothetical protein SPJ50_06825 [Ligilactobacillus salivarius]|nr:hypothetical protein [Ligilactobacillus salivarius]